VAEAAQHRAEDGADLIVVLDEEYRLGAALRGRATRRAVRLRGAIAAGQEDLERRALAEPAVDADRSAAVFDDAEHGGEAEARSLPDLLRREEGLEDARACRLVHAAPRVAD